MPSGSTSPRPAGRPRRACRLLARQRQHFASPGGVNSSHPLGGLLDPNLRAVASCGVVGSGRRRLGSPGGGTSTDPTRAFLLALRMLSLPATAPCLAQRRRLAMPAGCWPVGGAPPCLAAPLNGFADRQLSRSRSYPHSSIFESIRRTGLSYSICKHVTVAISSRYLKI